MCHPKRELIIVRHFESESNKAIHAIRSGYDYALSEMLKSIAYTQYRLTEEGIKKGEPIGAFLRESFPTFDRCFSSDMVRAIETGLIVNEPGGYYAARDQHTGWEVTPLIRERFWGDLEQPGADIDQLVRYHVELRKKQDIFTWQPPNGESFDAAMHRARTFLRDIHVRRFKNPLVVSHGDFILALMAVIEGKTSMDVKDGTHFFINDVPPNGAIIHYRTTTEFEDDNPKAHNPFYFEEARETSKEHPTEFGPWRKIRHGGKTPEEMRAYIDRYPRVLN